MKVGRGDDPGPFPGVVPALVRVLTHSLLPSHVNGPTVPPTGEKPATPPKPRLLLVEDDPQQWMFFYEVLDPHYVVDIATSGTQAWEMAQFQAPDIVLADVILPGMDGFTLARRLRDDPASAEVPIILLSASSKIELLVRGLQAGAYDVMLKPVPVEELLRVLRERLAAR